MSNGVIITLIICVTLVTLYAMDNKAIKVIGGIGINKAIDVRKEIEHQVKNDGYRLPKQAVVPMEYVINYFHININYLKKLAKIERGE